ncbi:MAG: CPBP family intramembrane glutamic endopeptidase, partial [Bacteroidota bacterium]
QKQSVFFQMLIKKLHDSFMILRIINYLVIGFIDSKQSFQMGHDFPQDPIILTLILGIFFSTTGFTVLHFLNKKGLKNFPFRSSFPGDDEEKVKLVLFRRLSGITIYLILPLLIYLLLTGDNLLLIYAGKMNSEFFWWFFPLALLLILLNYLNAGRVDNLVMYPEIRKKEWTPSLIALSALSWIFYLFAYEFLFRGILLIPALELLGFWPAIVLNIGIYSLVHVPKGIKESIGAIFLGFLLCLLVIRTGSFWIAFFIHVVLALSSEWFSIYANPEMRIIRR